MDERAVAEAVDEVGELMRADGAVLILVAADPKTARIEVSLDLSGVDCLDCILPPAMLRDVLESAIQRRLPTEFEVKVSDPRLMLPG
ncbi:MAG TPA: hypothetical protein VHU85_04205 [Acidimicrobiales bacterium]|jgi:hypothetical protein|nr:hypothetical protein [Acidimicrobiales bacterium]